MEVVKFLKEIIDSEIQIILKQEFFYVISFIECYI